MTGNAVQAVHIAFATYIDADGGIGKTFKLG